MLIALLLFSLPILWQDELAFRVRDRVFFQSEVAEQQKQAQVFQCLLPDSALWRLLDLAGGGGIEPWVAANKLFLYAKLRGAALGQGVFDVLEDEGAKNKCAPSWSTEELKEKLKKWLRGEVFVRSRAQQGGPAAEAKRFTALMQTVDRQLESEIY